MGFKHTKIPINALYKILDCNFIKDWQQEYDIIYNFEKECGLVYTNQKVEHYSYKIVDEQKWLLAKIKYGI